MNITQQLAEALRGMTDAVDAERNAYGYMQEREATNALIDARELARTALAAWEAQEARKPVIDPELGMIRLLTHGGYRKYCAAGDELIATRRAGIDSSVVWAWVPSFDGELSFAKHEYKFRPTTQPEKQA